MPEWVRVAGLDECPPGNLLSVEVRGHRVVLANVDGDIHALQDECSHEDYPLSDGELELTELECIYHGATFDVRTGRALRLPAVKPVRTFQVDLRGSEIFVLLE
jgi:nitrite reductase/ring-hydroxylating ferredoxin subunit